jgi:hypothetical protein
LRLAPCFPPRECNACLFNHHSHPAWEAAILCKFHGAQAEPVLSKICFDSVG